MDFFIPYNKGLIKNNLHCIAKRSSMKKLLTLLFLYPLFAVSQDLTPENPDILTEPNPLKETYFQDKNNYKNVESMVTITKNKFSNFSKDTIRITYYNENGMQSKNSVFRNNKPEYVTLMTYSKDNKILSQETIENKNVSFVLYYYNKNKQLERTRQLRRDNIQRTTDTTEFSQKTFMYEKLNLVQTLVTLKGSAFKQSEQYIYDNITLIKKIGNNLSKEFKYDKSGNPIASSEYMGVEITPSKLINLKTFTYDNTNKLITDSLSTSSSQPKKYLVSNYTYENNGSLSMIKVNYDKSFRNIQFEYLADKIKKVNIETNDGNNAYLKFWIPSKISTYYQFPLTYQEIFDFDQAGNVISKKMYVNNELFSEFEYVITYKKPGNTSLKKNEKEYDISKKEIIKTKISEKTVSKEYIKSSNNNYVTTELPVQVVIPTDSNEVYNTVGLEANPEYPNGDVAMKDFIKKNYILPKELVEKKIYGKIYATFIIEKDGSLTDLKVLKDIGSGSGKEFLRVINIMPKWKPGVQNQINVRCRKSISFQIE